MQVAAWTMLACLSCASVTRAQDTLVFDAAVVKPAPAGARAGGYRIGPGSLTAEAVPLHHLITQAYGVSDYEVKGISGWMDSALYAISARAPSRADHGQMMAMLRNLLADRFKLKVHQETRPAPVYALVIANGGSKLQPARDGDSTMAGAITSERVTVPIGHTIADLVRYLNSRVGSMAIGRLVVDRTGLHGTYSIGLAFDNVVDSGGTSGRLEGDIPSSLSQQLGLKLQAAQADVTLLVVDQAERPVEQ
jgi:uncharacterized protein (TIGR03435 family)